MKVLITGASSGIGMSFAYAFAKRGDELILVARNQKKLENLKHNLTTRSKIIILDLSLPNNCVKLYEQIQNENIDILINNAGFGVFGKFENTNLKSELDMIDLNIKAVHILTKLFYQEFKEKNKGYILNVASSASFLPGPLMASYYATKAYVLRLTEALYKELRIEDKNVYVGVLCPGPVDTNFNHVAKIDFSVKPLNSSFVTDYAIRKMFQRKLLIIPGNSAKILYFIVKIIPIKISMSVTYYIQRKKCKNEIF